MATFKLVLGFKDGNCFQREVKEAEADFFIGKRIGNTIQGDHFSLEGYEFVITGGSDYCGFPMRKDIEGAQRKKVFAVKGVGLKKRGKGVKYRFSAAGNTIHDKTAQINLQVIKEGKEKFVSKKEAAEKKKVEEKPEVKVEKKEEPVVKKEEVKVEPKVEKEVKVEEVPKKE
jgi:small subunit ribosomal protein S6e